MIPDRPNEAGYLWSNAESRKDWTTAMDEVQKELSEYFAHVGIRQRIQG